MRLGLLGSTGVVGSVVGEVLAARGWSWVDIDLRDPSAGLGQVEVVVLATGGDLPGTRETVTTALERGVHVVDVDREVGHLDWLQRQASGSGAPAGGNPSGAWVVGAAGVRFAVGDLLAGLAAELVAAPADLHVAYTAGGGRTLVTPGERRAERAALGRPAQALQGHQPVEEHPGEVRRLAWFPRPVGPAHAAAVPGGEVLTVPLHRPELAAIRTYEALPSWRAELLQARANLARTRWGRRVLTRRLQGRVPRPGPARRAGQRWGCVAEVAGRGELGRAWAYGHDPVKVTAALAAELATRLAAVAAVPGQGGLRAPSQVAPASAVLDAIADATDLRWSRTHVDLPDR